MTMSSGFPSYSDLPPADGGARSAWNTFANPELGRFSLLGPDLVRRAATLVRTGEVFSLNAPVDAFEPPLFGRGTMRHTKIVARNGYALDDVYDNFFPQASSQWDALGHVCFRDDEFFGGATRADVLSGRHGTIEHIARVGIVARGVLLDVYGDDTPTSGYDPLTSHAVSVEDLERARHRAGIEYEAGDILLIRTGFIQAYSALDGAGRAAISARDTLHSVGLEHSERMAEYLWNTGACAVACDCPALEVWPPDNRAEAWPFGNLHRILLGQLGIAIGELWLLDSLAASASADQRYSCMVTSAPLNTPGGIGSTANAVAIR